MDKKQVRHYLYVGAILAGIGILSAAVIVGTNLITEQRIKENEIAAKNKAMGEVFSDCTFGEETKISDIEYLVSYTDAFKGELEYGSVYYTSGKNMYGSISMMVGIYVNGEVGHISLVENTESYASTIEDEYLLPYNENPTEESLDATKCGATYGANLIKDMAKAAQNHFKERKGL